MSDDEIEELREQVEALEKQAQQRADRIDDLELRYQAAMTKNDMLRDLVLGDLEAGEDAVREAPSLWVQVMDLRSEVADQRDRTDRLDDSGARGNIGSARKAKIRHTLVRRATNRGKMSIGQAAQSESPAFDYEDVLALFDHDITQTYASDLIDKAAAGNAAFWVKKPSNPRDGRKELRVDVTELDEDSPYLRDVRQFAQSERTNEDFAQSVTMEDTDGEGVE